MHIPKRLKIGGHWYEVKYPYHFSERGDVSADHDLASLRIRIDDLDSWDHQKRPESRLAIDLMHEIMHAVDLLSGHEVFKGPDGEKILCGISEGLFQVIRDNKLRFDDPNDDNHDPISDIALDLSAYSPIPTKDMMFVECSKCSAKPGNQTLCPSCLANRTTIENLKRRVQELLNAYRK